MKKKKIDCTKQCLIDCEYILVEKKKAECCKVEKIITKKEYAKYDLNYDEIIEEERIECCKVEEKKVELTKEIEELMSDTTKKDVEIIKYQKIKDINMSKSSVSEFDKIKKLNLTVEELRAIPRRRGVKNYENLPRIGLVKEINRLYLSKELKKKKILVVYY